MNICLINPPSAFLTNERVFPTMGLLRLATFLKQKNYNVKIFDMLSTFKYNDISKYIIDNKIDIIGITAVSPQIPIVIEIAKFIKNTFSYIKLIIGGPHITMSYNSLKKSNRIKQSFDYITNIFDTLVIGYGEYGIVDALKFDQKIINVEEKITNQIYEALPIPDRSFIDINSYNYSIENQKATSLINQFGCPFKCNFCGGRNSQTYNKTLTRSSDSIIKELDYLIKCYGYTGFMFYDDEINLKKEAFKELLIKLIDYQQKNSIQLFFRGFSRSDLMSNEEAKLMYEAGFRWVLLGFESGSDRILKNMNKLTTVQKNTQAIEIVKNNNLKIKALMSIGHPGESYETIAESKKWLDQIKPDELDVTILTLYPGTEYFDNAYFDNNKWVYKSKNNDILYSDDISFLTDKTFYKSKEHENSCFISTEYLSSNEILKCQDILYGR